MAENERRTFFTEDELSGMDGMLLETNSEIMKKAGEICGILGKRDSAFSSLRKAYRLTEETLKEKEDQLEKEEREKQEWMDKCNALQEKNRILEEAKGSLETKLNALGKEKEVLESRISQMSSQEEHYQTLRNEFEQIRHDCNQHYTDAKNDRDEAKAELERCRDDLAEETEKAEQLQTALNTERGQRQKIESEAKEMRSQLIEKDNEIHTLSETNRQYRSQSKKMPALMGLYDAYDAIMEKREELPHEFFECLQKAMPMDDFDCFVSAALRRSFPIGCYLSLKSFISVSGGGQASEEGMKKALRYADQLLEKVFAFGREYFKEEKLSRIHVEKGDPFEDDVCTYINGRGGMYGDIADVWLHGLRDEKDDRIYHSYVEGE